MLVKHLLISILEFEPLWESQISIQITAIDNTLIMCYFFFLNQQFVTQHAKADHGSYFVTMYKRNRSTGGQKLNRKREKKDIKEKN